MLKQKDLTPYQQDVYKAKICPYCKSGTKTVTEEFIYKKKYSDKSVICCINYPSCDSYVGTHSDGLPLGRLSKHPLRIAKKKTHEIIDRIWKLKFMDRKDLYKELSDFLQLELKLTHLGFMNLNTLDKVQRWALLKYIHYSENEKKTTQGFKFKI